MFVDTAKVGRPPITRKARNWPSSVSTVCGHMFLASDPLLPMQMCIIIINIYPCHDLLTHFHAKLNKLVRRERRMTKNFLSIITVYILSCKRSNVFGNARF